MPFHDDDAAVQITTAVKRVLRDLLSPDSVWWQEEHLMHAPLFHATVQEVRSRGPHPTQQQRALTLSTAAECGSDNSLPASTVPGRVAQLWAHNACVRWVQQQCHRPDACRLSSPLHCTV